ncbi:MAG: Uma2 family endonuclease [Chloroflexi bacterium]|nr:Uma2 family endonuclease [Chloroflexota bacterium]MCI0580539.1 Uma2 family endonuclease [Chloroflexota bacterium]MCI0648110.1 Uma2 family endonuclease [Chloroflexota bacterium]MCI0730545.1 Uma2 family endonuclease [Chloroflexota bacterium]
MEITPSESDLPPLNNGDYLSRSEFERRYQAQPDIKKAELIEGVVYMPSPARFQHHAQLQGLMITWLGTYWAATPGTNLGDNATLRLDLDNEPQPDGLLCLDEKLGGRSHIDEDDYLAGAPELVVEIAASSAAYDLHQKLHVYRRSGIQEYLVLLAYEQKTRWYALEEGEYRLLPAGEDSVIRSRAFPGLWFHPELFWAGSPAELLKVLQEGLNSAEHAEFVTRLQSG